VNNRSFLFYNNQERLKELHFRTAPNFNGETLLFDRVPIGNGEAMYSSATVSEKLENICGGNVWVKAVTCTQTGQFFIFKKYILATERYKYNREQAAKFCLTRAINQLNLHETSFWEISRKLRVPYDGRGQERQS